MVALPGLGIRKIRAKVDTGARTCSIHAERIEPIVDRPGWVRFEVELSRTNPEKKVVCEGKVIRVAKVKPSSGEASERYVIETTLLMGGQQQTIELNLVSRSQMRWRMLIGRRAIEGRYVVDVSQTYLLGEPSGKKQNDAQARNTEGRPS